MFVAFVAIMLFLVLVGTVGFHLFSPWWWTEIASNWGYIDDTIDLTFWVTGIVFIGVMLFIVYCIVRYPYKADRRAEYEPENTKLELWLTGLTALGVAIMLAPGLFVWGQFVTVPDDAVEVEVVGQQWQWSFRYPGADGVMGTSDIANFDDDNTFGINMNDSAGHDDVLIEGDDLHLQLGQPVKLLFRAIDVLHDFYVPEFRAKMDMVPGTITYVWLTPTRTGTFDILCFELCGIGHYLMRSTVVVDEPEDYQIWLAEQSTFTELMAEAGRDLGGDAELRVSEARNEHGHTMNIEPTKPNKKILKRVN